MRRGHNEKRAHLEVPLARKENEFLPDRQGSKKGDTTTKKDMETFLQRRICIKKCAWHCPLHIKMFKCFDNLNTSLNHSFPGSGELRFSWIKHLLRHCTKACEMIVPGVYAVVTSFLLNTFIHSME